MEPPPFAPIKRVAFPSKLRRASTRLRCPSASNGTNPGRRRSSGSATTRGSSSKRMGGCTDVRQAWPCPRRITEGESHENAYLFTPRRVSPANLRGNFAGERCEKLAARRLSAHNWSVFIAFPVGRWTASPLVPDVTCSLRPQSRGLGGTPASGEPFGGFSRPTLEPLRLCDGPPFPHRERLSSVAPAQWPLLLLVRSPGPVRR